jgi:hypothetical protein
VKQDEASEVVQVGLLRFMAEMPKTGSLTNAVKKLGCCGVSIAFTFIAV